MNVNYCCAMDCRKKDDFFYLYKEQCQHIKTTGPILSHYDDHNLICSVSVVTTLELGKEG